MALSDNVKAFRRLVLDATPSLTTLKQKRVVQDLPDSLFERVFTSVFREDLSRAKDILFRRYDGLDEVSAIQEIENIQSLDVAVNVLTESLLLKTPILVISDADADGSTTQSIMMILRRSTDACMTIDSKTYDASVHGFNVTQVQDWLSDNGLEPDSSFVTVVTDLGTNQSEMQLNFVEMFPNAKLVIIDHHKPDPDLKVQQIPERSVWVSPYSKGGGILAGKNGGGVSAGFLTALFASKALSKLKELDAIDIDEPGMQVRLKSMMDLGKVANFLDGVECDTLLKPLHDKDIDAAYDLSSLVRVGRSASKWLRPSQSDNIKALLPLMGDVVVDELLSLRRRYMHLNHLAGSLISALKFGLELDLVADNGAFKLSEKVAEISMQGTIEASAEINYIGQMRPWLFYLSYEGQMPAQLKSPWLDVANSLLRELGNVDRAVSEQLRKHDLITQKSTEFVMMTQPASVDVERAFSPRELRSAYKPADKIITLVVSATYPDKVVFNCKSELSMFEVLNEAAVKFPDARLDFRGNQAAGGLTMYPKGNSTVSDVIPKLLDFLQERASDFRQKISLRDPVLLEPAHLPLVNEMFRRMRLHIESYAAPTMLMRVPHDMVFEDKYSLEKHTAEQLALGKPWEQTVEPLDFSGNNKLSVPNQVFRSLSLDGFTGAMAVNLMPNGAYLATKTYSAKQIDQANVYSMTLPIEKDRVKMSKEYKKNFYGKDEPVIEYTREEVVEALEFARNNDIVVDVTENAILSVLKKAGVPHYNTVDVETDGPSSAQMTNIGIWHYMRNPESAIVMTKKEFDDIVEKNPESIRNFEMLDDGTVRVNENLRRFLLAQMIGMDGDLPILVSLKAQHLTNIYNDFLRDAGEPSHVVLSRLVNYFQKQADTGGFIVQGHNWPFDNNAIRNNFPELYDITSNQLHLDSAIPAKELYLAYSGHSVSSVHLGGPKYVDFANNPYKGYNISSMLENPALDSFDFPSIKGTYVMQVRGEAVSLFDVDSRRTVALTQTRDVLAYEMRMNMGNMKSPQYGIQKFMRVLPIIDALRSGMPVKMVKEVPFDGFGLASFDSKLWSNLQFQYPYDRNLSESMSLMRQVPEIRDFMETEFRFASKADVPESLAAARLIGTGEMYNEHKKTKDDKEAQKLAESLLVFKGEHILKANLIEFLNNNKENAERVANTWLYELVLHHHELNTKSYDVSQLQGLSEELGVPEHVLESIYSDIYKYCKARGIQSYHIQETHNIYDLKGDSPQEVHAVYFAAYLKLNNPFISRRDAIKLGLDPNRNVVDVMYKQMLRSTLMQEIRRVTGISVDGATVAVNSYSGKKMQTFSEFGVSELTRRLDDSSAQIRCRTMDTGSTEVRLNLPKVDKQSFLSLPENERKHLEQMAEMVVSALVYSNSSNNKGLSASAKIILDKVSTHPAIIFAMNSLKERFEVVEATSRTDQVKKLMSQITSAILGEEELKLSVNKDVPPKDLELMHEGVLRAVESLSARGFVSKLNESELTELLRIAAGEYYCNLEARILKEKVHELPPEKTGGKSYDLLTSNAKREQTNFLKILCEAPKVYDDILPELARTATTKKKDPIKELLTSPLVSLAFSSEMSVNLTPEQDIAMALRGIIKDWPEEERKIFLDNLRSSSPDKPVNDAERPSLKLN